MEVKINKEIRDYTENIYFGLNLRQFICALLGVAVSVGLYFLLRHHLGKETLSWVCMLGAFPFIAIGFLKYNGIISSFYNRKNRKNKHRNRNGLDSTSRTNRRTTRQHQKTSNKYRRIRQSLLAKRCKCCCSKCHRLEK